MPICNDRATQFREPCALVRQAFFDERNRAARIVPRDEVADRNGAPVSLQRKGEPSCRLVRAGAIAPSEFIGHVVEGVRAAGVDIGEPALDRGVKQCETLLAFLDQTRAFPQYLALRA